MTLYNRNRNLKSRQSSGKKCQVYIEWFWSIVIIIIIVVSIVRNFQEAIYGSQKTLRSIYKTLNDSNPVFMQNIFFAIFKMKTITLILKAVTYQDMEQ